MLRRGKGGVFAKGKARFPPSRIPEALTALTRLPPSFTKVPSMPSEQGCSIDANEVPVPSAADDPSPAPQLNEPLLGSGYILASAAFVSPPPQEGTAGRNVNPDVLDALEAERQWIAYEVHDRIAQTLFAVSQQIQTMESLTRIDSSARQLAVRASLLVREAIREARNIMNDLHPPALDEFGLAPLIEEELRRFQEDTGCNARLTADWQTRPPTRVEVALYRIFHETLINIRRHAPNARSVVVTLASADHSVSLKVEDDGPGFDVLAAVQRKHVGGLMSMQRRAEIIGGRLEVHSSPGQGTCVTLQFPVEGNACAEKRHDNSSI